MHTEYVHDEETGEEVKKLQLKQLQKTLYSKVGCFHKGEKEKCLRTRIKLSAIRIRSYWQLQQFLEMYTISVSFFDAYEELINGKYGYLIKNVSLDADTCTCTGQSHCTNDQIPYMPYKRPISIKKDFFKTNMSMMKNMTVIYVQDKILMYTTTTRNGYRQYNLIQNTQGFL